jgi:adenosylmethionine-8-amino-7-oxononanoate aminotransferase
MSVCDPDGGMHHMFSHVVPQHFFVPAPTCRTDQEWNEQDIAELRATLGRHHHEIAAVILEPLVQGAGGMRVYCPEYLRRTRALCSEHDVLLIADEIATGFGRTGSMFACEQAGISPDIMCLGKALTGGYLSMAATLTTPEISETISSNPPGAFMHGPTFMANPLACSIACASIDLLLASPWRERIATMEAVFGQKLGPCRDLPGVADVRIKGGIGVLELERPVDMPVITGHFIDKGVWLRPFGKLVYIMPPYIISEADLEHLLTAMVETIEETVASG